MTPMAPTRMLSGICAALAAALIATPAMAQSWDIPNALKPLSSGDWSVELSSGAEYDSYVFQDQLDVTTGTGDSAMRLRGEVDYKTQITPDTQLGLGYTLSDKRYMEASQFDLQLHIISGTAKHDFGPVTAGTAVRHIDANLGGEGFQASTQFSPFVSGYITRQVLLRGTYTLTDKQFDVATTRDAQVQTADAKAYVFLDGSKRYLVVGVAQRSADAQDDRYSFNGVSTQIRLSQRFNFLGRTARAQARWRYETRDFIGETPSISAPREDDRHRFAAEVELPVSDTLFMSAEYERGEFASNLPSADFSQDVFTLRAVARY